MSLLVDEKDKVSIVVITYNRYAYLERLLSFYEKYSFPFPVIVLDSSTDNDASTRLNQLLNHKRVLHKKYPEDLFLGKKIVQGLNEVKTEYCVLNAEDDILIPRGIGDCVAFLEENRDYSIAQGFFTHHTIKEGGAGRPEFFWGPLYEKQKSIDFDMPEDRLRFAFTSFHGVTLYSVFRTSLMRLIWAETADRVNNYCLFEILPFILGVMHSKVKVLPVFYSSREMNTYAWPDHALHRKMYSPELCAPVIDCWAYHLSRLRSIDYTEAKKNIKENFDLYLSLVWKKTEKSAQSICCKKSSQKTIPGSDFLGKALRRILWHWNKFYYRCLLNIHFGEDFGRVKRAVTAVNINPDLMRRTRQNYTKLNGME